MLGALIYITLDVTFNVIFWTSKKTIEGIELIYNKVSENLVTQDNNNNNAILPPSYENTIKIIEGEVEKELQNKKEEDGVSLLLEQIKLQKKILNNLEASIINYKMDIYR